MRPVSLCLAILGCFAAAEGRASAGLIVNGGFETGDFSGWTLVGDPTANFVAGGYVHTGINAAYLGQNGSLATLSQTFATTLGASYTLSFWFSGSGDNPSEFIATVGSNRVLDLINPPFDSAYHLETFQFTAEAATTRLAFGARDDANYLNLDDVDVTPSVVVAEPASIVLLALGSPALMRGRPRRSARRSAPRPKNPITEPTS